MGYLEGYEKVLAAAGVEKTAMPKFFHGSPHQFKKFKPATEVGTRPGEEGRKGTQHLTFLTEDRDVARQYAGPEGYVYVTDVPEDKVTQYRQWKWRPKGTGKKRYKNRKASPDIYVAEPENVSIEDIIEVLTGRSVL